MDGNRTSFVRRSVFLLALSLSAGCGGSPEVEKTVGSKDPAPAVTAAAPSAETPEKAILAAIDGLKDKRPEAIWDFLPESYQRDLTGLVRDFASRMDNELWARSMQTLGRLASVLKTRLQALPPESGAPDWEGFAALLETVAGSELGDLKRLARVDPRQFLTGTGHRLLEQLEYFSVLATDDPFANRLAELSQTEATLQSSEGEVAIVQIELPGQGQQLVSFVRVDGKWIPRALADGWIEFLGQTRARLSLLAPDAFRDLKPRWLALLGRVDASIERLETAKGAADFDQAFESVKFALRPLLGMLAGGLPDVEEPTATNLVTVVVVGELDEAAFINLQDRLRAALPPQAFFESTGSDDLTSFTLGPVPDVKVFADALSFLPITRIDLAGRIITARPPK